MKIYEFKLNRKIFCWFAQRVNILVLRQTSCEWQY